MTTNSILVVDDILSARKLYSTLLTQKGYSVTDVENGREAIDLIKEKKFNLIITDINMPKIDGFGLLTWLEKRKKNIPVIVISAISDKNTVLKTAHFKITKFFTKPLKTHEFLKTVKTIVEPTAITIDKTKDVPQTPDANTTTSFKKVLNRFSKKTGLAPAIELYTPQKFIAELLDLTPDDYKENKFDTLQKIKQELELWKDSPKLLNAVDVFRHAFKKGNLPVKQLCVDYLPSAIPIDTFILLLKEWIFARDHRVRIKVVERLEGVKHKDAIKILLACEEDNVHAIQEVATRTLSKHRLSHLVIPIVMHYSERNLPLSSKYNKLLFHSNHALVYEELKSFIKKANIQELCYMVNMISITQWHEGLSLLIQLSTNPSEKVRLSTIDALCRFREHSTSMYLTKMFHDPVHDIRISALNALRESTTIKNSTQIFLLLFEPTPTAAWEVLPDIVKDLEKSNSAILQLCSNLHGTSLEKRLANFYALSKTDIEKFKKQIPLLTRSIERNKNSLIIQFLQEFNDE